MALWADVAGYEGLYLISDEGEVISLPRIIHTRNKYGDIVVKRKQRRVKPHKRGGSGSRKDYLAVTLTDARGSKAYSLHRLVAIAFIPNPDNLPEVNHKDKNTMNNKANNLEWCDRQYNIDYSKSKRIAQYLDGVKIAEYKSIAYASRITGILRTSINNVLTGWSETAGGYEWRYVETKEKE